jgi:hypothetical protein
MHCFFVVIFQGSDGDLIPTSGMKAPSRNAAKLKASEILKSPTPTPPEAEGDHRFIGITTLPTTRLVLRKRRTNTLFGATKISMTALSLTAATRWSKDHLSIYFGVYMVQFRVPIAIRRIL